MKDPERAKVQRKMQTGEDKFLKISLSSGSPAGGSAEAASALLRAPGVGGWGGWGLGGGGWGGGACARPLALAPARPPARAQSLPRPSGQAPPPAAQSVPTPSGPVLQIAECSLERPKAFGGVRGAPAGRTVGRRLGGGFQAAGEAGRSPGR